jgi:hypothetical protein
MDRVPDMPLICAYCGEAGTPCACERRGTQALYAFVGAVVVGAVAVLLYLIVKFAW